MNLLAFWSIKLIELLNFKHLHFNELANRHLSVTSATYNYQFFKKSYFNVNNTQTLRAKRFLI